MLFWQDFVLSYIGLGSSIGLSLKIPIIVRSLAGSFALLEEADLPIGFDLDFITTLDTDLAEQDPMCKIMDKYECAWWTQRKPRNLDSADVLDRSSFDKCLQTHLNQIDVQKGGRKDLSSSLISPTKITTAETSANNTLPLCLNCETLTDILSNTLVDVVDLHSYANTMVTSGECQWNIDMRRASMFNLLYEAAVIKETAVAPSAISASVRTVDSVAANARNELRRLQEMPPSSHKWTWGESLTKTEVSALSRSKTKPKNRVHSGYDLSLKDGNRQGVDSSTLSLPDPVNENEIRPSTHDLPDYTFKPIPYFKRRLDLIYDPLGKIRHSHSISPTGRGIPELAALTTENVSRHTELAMAVRESSRADMAESSGNGPVSWKSDSQVAEDWPNICCHILFLWSDGTRMVQIL